MSRLACVWMPHLIAQLEQCRLSSLRQPLIVREGDLVLDVSAQAAQCGVLVGDSLVQALARAPEALLVEADLPRYCQAWEEVVDIVSRYSPSMEEERWGIAYLEAEGMGALYNGEEAWIQVLRHSLHEYLGVQALVGVAGNKFTSRVAAQSSPDWRGYTLVQGADAAFLAPLSIEWLPLSGEVQRRLRLLGITTLGGLARLPASAVAEQFGPECLEAHRWAMGHDNRPLLGRRRQVLVSTHAFELPEVRREALLYLLDRLLKRLLAELSAEHLSARCLQARFELAGGQIWSKSTWANEGLGPQLLPGLLDAMLRELEHAPVKSEGVMAIELQLTALESAGGRQLQLFTQLEDRYRLRETLDKLAKKHVGDTIWQVQPALLDDEVAAAHYQLRAL